MSLIQKLSKKLEKLKRAIPIHFVEPVSTKTVRNEEIWLVDINNGKARTDTGKWIKIDPEVWNKHKTKDPIVKYDVTTGFGITKSGEKIYLTAKAHEFTEILSTRAFDEFPPDCKYEHINKKIRKEKENSRKHGGMPTFKSFEPIKCITTSGESIMVKENGWHRESDKPIESRAGRLAWALTDSIKWVRQKGVDVVRTLDYYLRRPLWVD